ncbi:MAG: FAD:protein FMN transferase [Aliarcobacter sp.]|nr:FAD:protein FMN transferase [Aliarcobacter sp.]
MSNINRRKFLNITAMTLALPFCSNSLFANIQEKITWKGIALGADSNMTLFHKDKSYAKESLNICINEIKRLENIFSLFDNNSSISQLNKEGYILNPPKELVEVLNFANNISENTNGAFDATVQPLWIIHKSYSKHKNIAILNDEIQKVKNLISYKNIEINKNKIYFKKENMQITLNGIAQGYITDKITNILEQRGFTNVLVNLGEFNSIGGYDENRDWNIATPYLNDIKYLKLNNNAVASSGGYGTRFDEKYHHLFDVNTGTSANYINSVTIKASNAMLADALSTAVFVMSEKQREKIKSIYPNIEIYTS